MHQFVRILATFIGLMSITYCTQLQSQCSLLSLSANITDTATCGGPLSLELMPTGTFDTTPIYLSQWNVVGFQNDFQFSFSSQPNGCYYVLTISGRYTVWSETPQFYDAFYRYDTLTNQPLLPADNYLQFPTPLFVEPAGYNPDHVYRLYYPGDGSNVQVQFTDDLYSDNWGEMSFEWSVVPCIEFTWVAQGLSTIGPTFSHTFTDVGNYQVNLIAHDKYYDCSLSTWIDVTIFPQPEVSIQTTPTCPNSSTGIAAATPMAGTPPFTYEWGSGLSANDQITGLAAGTYAMTIVDANGCQSVSSFQIESWPDIDPQVEILPPTCPGMTDGQVLIANPQPEWQYEWDGTLSDQWQWEAAAGTHQLTIYFGSGCTRTMSIEVPQAAPWWVEIGLPSRTLFSGDTATLWAILPPDAQDYTLEWQPAQLFSCTNCLTPIAYLEQTTTIQLTAISATGCVASQQATLKVAPISTQEIFAPNTFTPNGDGINDTFTLFGSNVFTQIEHLTIISRWGGTAWEGQNLPLNDPSLGWDGTINGQPAPTGVYVWMAKVKRIDGHTLLKKGSIALIR